MGVESLTLSTFSLMTFISLFLYLLMLIHVQRKLKVLQSNTQELTTTKMFVMSVWVACLVRVMSFAGLGALGIANVEVHYDVGGEGDDDAVRDTNQSFYDKAYVILFDLPDYIIVSTYLLQTLVYSECFLSSRLHTLSKQKFRRSLMRGYLGFNVALYGGQMALYVMLFVTGDDEGFADSLRQLLFVIVTGVNYVAVIITFVLYVVLTCKFSGFPFRSKSAEKAFGKISWVVLYWSVARVLWGVAMIEAYENNIGWFEGSTAGSDNSVTSLILVVLLILCELGPIFQSLDYSFGNIISLSANKSSVDLHEGYEPLEDADFNSVGTEDDSSTGGNTTGSGGGRRGGSRWSQGTAGGRSHNTAPAIIESV